MHPREVAVPEDCMDEDAPKDYFFGYCHVRRRHPHGRRALERRGQGLGKLATKTTTNA
jgi:hypothetical protein